MWVYAVGMCVQLVRTLRHVLSAHDWWHLPRFAFGSSRGGAMTLILAMRFPFQVGHRDLSLKWRTCQYNKSRDHPMGLEAVVTTLSSEQVLAASMAAWMATSCVPCEAE